MSDDKKKTKSSGMTILELGLLAGCGGWLCVSSLMEVLGQSPKANALAQATAAVIGALGVWPTFLTSLALAALGAWSFLAPRDVGVWKHAAGALFCGLGLAIAVGPFSGAGEPMGGGIGDVMPGLVSGRLGVALAVGLGLAVILAVTWLLWLPETPEGAGFSPKPGEQRQVRAAGSPEAGGVTLAEAEALVADVPRAKPIPSVVRTPQPADDVRIQGGVPAGAQPLQKTHEPERSEDHDQDAARPWDPTPTDWAADELAGEDLAAAGAARPLGDDAGEPVAPEAARGAEADALSGLARPLDDVAPVVLERPSWEAAEEVAAPEPMPEPAEAELAAADDDEPGETLVEAAWEPAVEPPTAAWEPAPDEYEPPVDDVLKLEDDEPAEAEEPRPAAAAEASTDEELLERMYAEEAASEVEDDEEEFEDDEEELEEDEELEEEEELEEAHAEDDSEDEDDEEELEEDEELEEVHAEDDSDAEAEELDSDPVSEPAPALEPAVAEADAESDVVLKPKAPRAARVQQSSLFPDEDRANEPESTQAEPTKPAKAPKSPKTKAAAASPEPPASLDPGSIDASRLDADEDLIYQAGLMFLDEGRVAVSMLQRRFELEFDQATTVLDALQTRGLIGPYLGGKTRDILMTREEWTAHAHGV